MTTISMAVAKDNSQTPVRYTVSLFLAPDAAPGGSISLGTFTHADETDNLPGHDKTDVNHVWYHHVRDALYKRNWSTLAADFWPDNVVDMHRVDIVRHGTRMNVDYIKLTGPAASIAVGATGASVVKAYKDDNTELATVTTAAAYTSDTPAVATVNAATGVVTGVAPGKAIITANYLGRSDTSEVTIIAAG